MKLVMRRLPAGVEAVKVSSWRLSPLSSLAEIGLGFGVAGAADIARAEGDDLARVLQRALSVGVR